MRKPAKYAILIAVAVITIINSVNFRDLDEVRAAEASADFDAVAYAQNFWEQERPLLLEQALNIVEFYNRLEQNFDSTAAEGEMIGISDYRYFIVDGSGTVEEILEDDILVELDGLRTVRLATGFIFGNTVRNAVPQIEIGEFTNMTQFNQVSIQINNIVEDRVVPELREQAGIGREVSFTGAISINVESREMDSIRVVPLRIAFTEEQ